MEVPDFVEMTRDMDITVRAIEFMPFEGGSFSRILSRSRR